MIDRLPWDDLPPGSHRLSCPACGRGPKDKTLGVTIETDGRAVAHCFRCGQVQTRHPDREKRAYRCPTPKVRPMARKFERLSDDGLRLWRDCRPITPGTVGGDYLLARRCVLPPQDGDLRYHTALPHSSGYDGPALVALITDARSKEPLSLHRTWIRADGTKADVDPPRLLLSGHRKQGGVIRLWPDEAVTTGLGVAEGIETALSLAHGYTPVWSLVDAGNMAVTPVLAGIEALVIAADNDPAGLQAADELARRWAAAGREVIVTRQAANDLNDTLRGLAA